MRMRISRYSYCAHSGSARKTRRNSIVYSSRPPPLAGSRPTILCLPSSGSKLKGSSTSETRCVALRSPPAFATAAARVAPTTTACHYDYDDYGDD